MRIGAASIGIVSIDPEIFLTGQESSKILEIDPAAAGPEDGMGAHG